MYPICYRQVSGGYIQPEPAMYSRCFRWFPGPLAPSVFSYRTGVLIETKQTFDETYSEVNQLRTSQFHAWLRTVYSKLVSPQCFFF